MYKYILEQASNINWMALFALLTFFSVFLISLLLVFRKNKVHLQRMAHLPLEDSFSKTPENVSQDEK